MKLYLDVDGVINAQMPPWSDIREARASGYRVRWSNEMITALRGLGLDLVWLTSWGRAAPENLAFELEYGIDAPAPVQVPTSWNWTTMEWKFPGLQRLEERDSRFVWIDDDIDMGLNPVTNVGWGGVHRDENWLDLRAEFPNALLISPKSHLGITPAHIEQIKKYMNG